MIDLRKFTEEFFALKPTTKEDWVTVYKAMIVHTRGVKPTELLTLKRPNEPTDIRDYRLANYRPITKHGINQAIDAVYRTLYGSNYSVTYSPNIDEYLTETEFIFLGEEIDFKQMFFRNLLRLVFDDPNGLLVWLPENPDKSLPPIENSETTPINVVPVYVKSPDIQYIDENVIAFKAGESIVEIPVNDKETRKEKHPWYYIISKEYIWKFIPFWSAEQKKVLYRTEDYYSLSITDGKPNHARTFPSLVGHKLGGNISYNQHGEIYYDSFFGSYVPFGDEAICAFSDNQGVRVRYNFPFVSIKGNKCVACGGTTKVTLKEGAMKGKQVTCGTCGGGGMTLPFNPHGHYVKEPPASQDNEAFATSPAVEFYSPDVAILEQSYTTWEKLLAEAKETVNLVFTKEAQSGVAKEIDRETKYETLMKISNNFFELMQWSLDIIEAYRVPNVANRKDSQVRKPKTFAVKTENELSAELNEMIAKESPQSLIATTAKRLSEKIYSDDDEAQRIIEIQTKWDVLFGKTSAQISQLKVTGGATTLDVMRNVNSYSILATMADEMDLDKMDNAAIIEEAEKRLLELMPRETLAMEETLNEDEMQTEEMQQEMNGAR